MNDNVAVLRPARDEKPAQELKPADLERAMRDVFARRVAANKAGNHDDEDVMRGQ